MLYSKFMLYSAIFFYIVILTLKYYVLNIDNEYKQGIVDPIKTCLFNKKYKI